MTRLIVVLLLTAAPAFAEDGPSFDCAKAESSAEKLVCENAELARLDRQVADSYSAALAAARGLDAGAAEAEDLLRATQRGWVKGRDECWKAADLTDCVTFAYQSRNNELVTQWMLHPPRATAFWACDGNPANEVVTMFYDTELPSVRFERGDSIDTGNLVRTASGSKYEGSFGRSIWIKGDAATYRDPDPDGTTYQCTLVREE
ncbi:MliC family protein [Shimia sp. SDUM112013]|uniref:MliC family protein n=1 Tax=Shimia sp. SDUM112013 TaxID=3136160 RepID=UPI0032EB6B5A